MILTTAGKGNPSITFTIGNKSNIVSDYHAVTKLTKMMDTGSMLPKLLTIEISNKMVLNMVWGTLTFALGPILECS